MKLDKRLELKSEISELLSEIKTSIVDVVADEPLREPCRNKLRSCLTTIEKICNMLKNDHIPAENLLKPLHAGLSKSMDSLNVKPGNGVSGARSISNLAEQFVVPPYNNEANAEDDEINNFNDLKENYLQVVDDVNNNRRINEDVNKEVKNTKSEINNGNMQEVNCAQPEVNGAEVTSKQEVEVTRRRRKRDSSTLFDISLDDLTEPDHSGILQEKHSGKEWWCVLQDQHLCMFPSQNPQELAYDVLLVPCCEISLDDAYTESPVFRLTQVGSTPWVFSAGIERNLRAWIRALCRASGRDDVTGGKSFSNSGKSRRDEKKKKSDMKVFSTTIEEMEEEEEQEMEEEEEQERKEETAENKIEEILNIDKKENIKLNEETKDDDSKDEMSSCKHKKITTQNLLIETAATSNSPVEISSNVDDVALVAGSNGNGMPVFSFEEKSSLSRTQLMRRKSTTRRIKMFRWFKKTLFGDDGQDVAVIGDIYKVDITNNNLVKLWCLVRNRELYCYRNIMQDNIEIVLPLDNCHAVPGAQKSSHEFLFHIVQSDQTRHTFVAKTDREMARWMEIVKNKRGMVYLGEFIENEENEEEDDEEEEEKEEEEKEEEEEEEDDKDEDDDDEDDDDEDDDEGYCFPNEADCPLSTSLSSESELKYATSPGEDITSDWEYVSVLDIEDEIVRRKSSKKRIPNTSKADIKNLTEKKNLFNINIPKGNIVDNTKQNRSPAPLPRGVVSVGKKTKQNKMSLEESSCEKKIYERPHEVLNFGNVANMTGQHSDGDEMNELPDIDHSGDDSVFNSEGVILKCNITASSSLPDSSPCQTTTRPGSTEMTGTWRPEINDKNQFLEIDLGEIVAVAVIGIQGRPDSDEKGGAEYVKSYTLSYSNTRDAWSVYKSHGKTKVFQNHSSTHQENKKSLKNITARYFRICPQSWNNHIALRVTFYKEQQVNQETNIKSKSNKKKTEKTKLNSPDSESTLVGHVEKKLKKNQIKKKDISPPMFLNVDDPPTTTASSAPASVNETASFNQLNGSEDQVAFKFVDSPTSVQDGGEVTKEAPQSSESRRKLRENLLAKEKKEKIILLETLKKRMNYAKDKMIIVNNSNQHKVDIDIEEQYLTVNLELVKVKKRLTDIESEMRELRLFSSQQREQQEEVEKPKPVVMNRKPIIKRRPSKEIKISPDVMSPSVDKETFNPTGEQPPSKKVLNNIKIFENLNM